MVCCWFPLIMVAYFFMSQLCQSAVVLQSSTTEDKGIKNTDILRQLINQETMIRMSLSRDVQSLHQQQRTSEKTEQATNKTLDDLQAAVQLLTSVTEALNRQSLNLTNEVSSLLRNKQEAERTDRSQNNKTSILERKLKELSNQTTQNSLLIGDVNSDIRNLSTQTTGLRIDLLGYADAIVQGACAAVSTGGFVSAVRRTCSNTAPSCDQVCKGATSQMKSKMANQGGKEASCFQAFHFYGPETKIHSSSAGQVNRIMYRYDPGDCSGQFCGPNFCCCRL